MRKQGSETSALRFDRYRGCGSSRRSTPLPAFESLVAELGVATAEEPDQRAEQVIRFLPKLWDTAEAIMRKNPDIVEK